MVHIYYNKSVEKLKSASFHNYLEQMPPFIQKKIADFTNWQDGQRCLIGKILLLKGLTCLGANSYSLENLKFTEFHRPFFDSSIDFNISHSGNYCICVISKTHRVGIDIEEIRPLRIHDFNNQFAEDEWKEMLSAGNNLHRFYRYWTKKEAFLKAIGVGLNLPLNKISIKDDKITWNNKQWFLKEIPIEQEYISYLSTDTYLPDITLEKLDLN